MTTDTMTRFGVHANGVFWGLFAAANADAAIRAAAAEHGTEGNADGLTAATLAETLQRIDRDYRDNDMTMAEGVAQWSNASSVDWDGGDSIWIEGPQTGHWLNDDKMADFIAWVEA